MSWLLEKVNNKIAKENYEKVSSSPSDVWVDEFGVQRNTEGGGTPSSKTDIVK